jgi:hypothetical protein
MSDVAAAIRAKLDSMVEGSGNLRSCASCEGDCYCQAYVDYQAALLAVLELHRRVGEDWTHVSETAYEAGHRWALEQAVSEIATALGVDCD